MKKIVTILALLALLTSCGTKNTEEPTNLQTPDVQPITVDVDENGNVVIPEDEITGTGSDEFINDVDGFLDSVISDVENGIVSESGATNE